VDIQTESMGPERLPNSVQHYMSLYLSGQQHFDVLLDDDGPNEVADLVGMTAHDTDITITLVHCKYSSEPSPPRPPGRGPVRGVRPGLARRQVA